MGNVIQVEKVTKTFKEHTVLNQVSMQVDQGTICGIVGTNGSGKTGLLKIICGFMWPDEGKVVVGGNQIGVDCDFPKDTGIIIEIPVFSPYSSGYANLKNLASIQKKISDEKICEVMEMVGLDPKEKKWVSKYSLGMRQRLGIAQAIMEGQNILILDEPMNGLDRQGVEEIRNLLLRMKEQGKTILLASHYPQDVEMLCDDVYGLDQGKLIKN